MAEKMASNILKYNIASHEVYGRLLTASDDIKMGEVIFRDQPLVVGPKIKSVLICINCYKPIFKKFHCCSKCKLAPLCDVSCESYKGWHTDMECEKFSGLQDKITVPMLLKSLHLVTILRCILLCSKDDKSDWLRFIDMESHIEKRRNTGIWNMHERSTKVLHEINLLEGENDINEFIQKICGIMDVNSFELRSSSNDTGVTKTDSICGIYQLAALMAHNCVPNTHLSIDHKFNMSVRASVPIEKGQPIFYNYTNALQGTINRKEHLREGKYFECNCDRCCDPSELGTNMSSLKCTKCTSGLITMFEPTKSEQFKKNSIWECKSCLFLYTGEEIKSILDDINSMFAEIDTSNPKSIEAFLISAEQCLHPNHHILLEAKHLLAGLLRDILNRSLQQPKKILARKLDICNDFLPILSILEPGISRLRAITLYEMHIPMVQITNKDHDAREISNSQLLKGLKEAEKILKEAIQLLLYEPIATPEGKLCRRAIEELRLLQTAIEEATDVMNAKFPERRRHKNKNN